ncbi:MAG TPA: hypothetical protein VIL18_10980 [Longimicrobiales bacterium]
MRRMRWAATLVAAALAGCATAGEPVRPERLRISAQDAAREANTVARAWAPDAALRFLEGEGVTPDGYVEPGRGAWRVVYEAPGRAEQLVVTATPTGLERATRPPQSPAGYVLEDGTLPPAWVDSPQAAAAARQASGARGPLGRRDAAVSMLLVPLQPPQWVIRAVADGQAGQWRVDAASGAVLP